VIVAAGPSRIRRGRGGSPDQTNGGTDPEIHKDQPVNREPSIAVRLVDVNKRYGDVVAVAGLTLEVKQGEFLALLGPSGSGKTTTMRLIGGFEQPDGGRVELSGRDVTDLEPTHRDVNTVFQSYALFPHLTVADNVGYGLKVRRIPRVDRHKRVALALEMVRLAGVSGRKPRELSGGMQQRVALARALVNQPSVLLLDEPLAALDRKLREDMQVELRQLQRTVGTTFVYVTHDQDEALAMSDRLAVMHEGRLQQVGPPLEVYDNPSSLWVAGFVGKSNQIRGTVRMIGDLVDVATDVGPVHARHPHGRLAAGDAVGTVVRPERMDILASAPAPGPNQVQVRLTEILSHGHQTTYVGHTPGGLELVARHSRRPDSQEVSEGADVWFRWLADSVHVYPLTSPLHQPIPTPEPHR
jgi:spermidine/putrescine transport system ATP-binding protein